MPAAQHIGCVRTASTSKSAPYMARRRIKVKYVFEFWLYRKHDFVQLCKLNLSVSVFVCLLMGTVREKIVSGENDSHCQVEEIDVNLILIILTAA